MREERKQNRTAELIQTNEHADLQMQMEAIQRSKTFDVTVGGKYSTWRREFQNSSADGLLKYMKDQVILAKVYSSIAHSNKTTRSFSDMLNRDIKQSEAIIGEATSDGELKDGLVSFLSLRQKGPGSGSPFQF